jgi:nicotinate-nucleotide adenylyltransferase
LAVRPFGVFGGMFDPIHYGHLRTAHELHELLGLEAVAFVPAGDPPHRAAPFADAATRLAMVRAATGDDPRFRVDDRELRRAGPSYTILTLQELRAERGTQPLVLILGMDAFAGIDLWHRAAEIATLAHIVIALRPQAGLPQGGLAAALLRERRCEDPERLAGSPAGLVHVSDNTQLDLSSSAVRAVIAGGRDPRYLMPEAARRIILARGSYARPGDKKE